MKITRNGENYELTRQELVEAFQEVCRMYGIENITNEFDYALSDEEKYPKRWVDGFRDENGNIEEFFLNYCYDKYKKTIRDDAVTNIRRRDITRKIIQRAFYDFNT